MILLSVDSQPMSLNTCLQLKKEIRLFPHVLQQSFSGESHHDVHVHITEPMEASGRAIPAQTPGSILSGVYPNQSPSDNQPVSVTVACCTGYSLSVTVHVTC